MESNVIAKAVEISERIRDGNHSHAFASAVRDFVRALAAVPDCRPTELSSDEVQVLRTLSEGVIAHIEQRVSTKDDSGSVQVELVTAVYEIRRELEEINRWYRHFLAT